MISNHYRFFGNFCNATERLDEIKAFHREIELLIDNENRALKRLDVKIEVSSDLYDKKFHFENTLTRTLRDSVIINLAIFFEIELQNYCNELQRTLDLAVKYNDFKGSILEQFKIYSQKIVSLEFDFDALNWNTVKEIIELRNCIVHYDGWIEDFYGRSFSRADVIKNLSNNVKAIQFDEAGFIRLDEGACEQCISIIENFIRTIYNEILQRFPE